MRYNARYQLTLLLKSLMAALFFFSYFFARWWFLYCFRGVIDLIWTLTFNTVILQILHSAIKKNEHYILSNINVHVGSKIHVGTYSHHSKQHQNLSLQRILMYVQTYHTPLNNARSHFKPVFFLWYDIYFITSHF